MSAKRRCREACRAVLLALAAAAVASPVAAQSINVVSSLSFGSFVAGTGGSITVNPGPARVASGGVVVVGQGSSYTAASFRVSGTASANYAITLPANDTVVLSDGTHTMALNGFVSNPSGTGMLSGGGMQMIQVGATLTVAGGQPPGNYIGTFNVTVNYL